MQIGITSTIPVETIFASNNIPIDLNNLFITNKDRDDYLYYAENAGYPRNICNWIKGIYSSVLKNRIEKLISVSSGDCSNTRALCETLMIENVNVYEFSYPVNRDLDSIKIEIDRLIKYLNTDLDSVEQVRLELNRIREKVFKIDELCYKTDKISGLDNHLFLLNCSDFKRDYKEYEKEIDEYISNIDSLKESKKSIRLGLIGVPPIFDDLFEFVEENDARILFSEVPRQFAMVNYKQDIYNQYLNFTYPYDIFYRLDDINQEIEKRELDGIIHYCQTFCHRQIQDMIIKKKIDIPVLTLEGDRPGNIDERTKIRLESFLEMLHDLK